MSYLTAGREDWRGSSACALLFASVAGPATTLLYVGSFFALLERDVIMTDRQFAVGYRFGLGLNLLIEFAAVLISMAAVCALGLAVFGLPLSYKLALGLIAR